MYKLLLLIYFSGTYLEYLRVPSSTDDRTYNYIATTIGL